MLKSAHRTGQGPLDISPLCLSHGLYLALVALLRAQGVVYADIMALGRGRKRDRDIERERKRGREGEGNREAWKSGSGRREKSVAAFG